MKHHTKQTYQQRILDTLVHIQMHLDEDLSLETLADVAHFSAYHFHRIFRGMVGESVKEHVRRLRLERAAHRLKFTEQPVTTIAFDAGYASHEGFTRAFHAWFGESPSAFREQRSADVARTTHPVHFAADGRVKGFEPVEKGAIGMDVRIERQEPLRVMFVRHMGPYASVGAAWGRLMSWAGMRGLLGPATRTIGICHDDPEVTEPAKIRYDACIPATATEGFVGEGDIGVQVIAGGEFAVTTHTGPYQQLGESYAALCGRWLPRSGRELRSEPAFEVYLNNPQSTPPEQLLTEIYLPLV